MHVLNMHVLSFVETTFYFLQVQTDGLCLLLNYFLLLCFCFRKLDLLDRQTTQFNFPLSTLFVIFTFCG